MIENKHDHWFRKVMQRICVFFSIPILLAATYSFASMPKEFHNGIYTTVINISSNYLRLLKIQEEQGRQIEILRTMLMQEGINNAATVKR